MDVVAMIIAAILGIALIAIGIAHLFWSVGIMWPIRDPVLLAQTVVGRAGARRPRRLMSLGVAVVTLGACVVAFSAADHTSGGLMLTAFAILAALLFLARGAVGYNRQWQLDHPEEPFRTLDRKTYSPLCLGLGVGFLALVVMRLV
jgi:hypothetical protein